MTTMSAHVTRLTMTVMTTNYRAVGTTVGHQECALLVIVAPYLLTVLHSVWLGATAVRY